MLNKLKKEQEKRQYEKQYDYISVYDVATFIENEYKLPPYQVLTAATIVTYYMSCTSVGPLEAHYISALPCYNEEYFTNLNSIKAQYIDQSIYEWATLHSIIPGFENDNYWEILKNQPSKENMDAFLRQLSPSDKNTLSSKNEYVDILGEYIHELSSLMNDDEPTFSTFNDINYLEDIMKSYYYKRSDIEQTLGVKLPDTITPPLPNIESYDVHVANTNIDDTCNKEIATLTSRIAELEKVNLELRAQIEALTTPLNPKTKNCYNNLILALKDILLANKVFKNQSAIIAYLDDKYHDYQGLKRSNLSNVFSELNREGLK